MAGSSPNEFYERIASALETTIESVYDETDETDAGASFASGHNIQISPYMDEKYTLNFMDEETFTLLFSSNNQQAILDYIKTEVKHV